MTLKITGSLNHNQEAGNIEESFRDGDGCPVDGSHAVFPIIQMRDDAPWSPIATGFFISNNGLFATAKHVVTDCATGKLLDSLAGIQLIPSKNRIVIREAIKIVTHDKADVAVGFLVDKNFQERGEQTVNKCFSVTSRVPAIGCKVATFAFPKGHSVGTPKEFSMQFHLSSVVGQLEEYHPEGRDRVILPSS